jgi:hypothetical protein
MLIATICRDDCCRPSYEGPRVLTLSQRTPTARIGHDCQCCRRPIPAGQRYRRTVELVDGQFTVTKTHTYCAQD